MILAEFVGVILVIALAPVAKTQSSASSASSGVSPYSGGDMVKLAAATLLYVILGFVAITNRGAARIAAWFGGLALITVGLAEGASLANEFSLFTGNLLAFSGGGPPSGGSPLANVGTGIANAALNLPPAVIAGSGTAGAGAGVAGGVAGVGAAALQPGLGGGQTVTSPGVTENPDVGALFPVVHPAGGVAGVGAAALALPAEVTNPPTVRVGQSSLREQGNA